MLPRKLLNVERLYFQWCWVLIVIHCQWRKARAIISVYVCAIFLETIPMILRKHKPTLNLKRLSVTDSDHTPCDYLSTPSILGGCDKHIILSSEFQRSSQSAPRNNRPSNSNIGYIKRSMTPTRRGIWSLTLVFLLTVASNTQSRHRFRFYPFMATDDYVLEITHLSAFNSPGIR